MWGAGAAAHAGTRSGAQGKEQQRRSEGFSERAAAREEKWLRQQTGPSAMPTTPQVCRTPLCPFLFSGYFLMILAQSKDFP
ncbi:MAG: hypothetical protein NC124_03495 [Clostridium sp.]|nr:hypothetical protein [Clostridium sp.]